MGRWDIISIRDVFISKNKNGFVYDDHMSDPERGEAL